MRHPAPSPVHSMCSVKNQLRFHVIRAFLQTVLLPLPFVYSFSFCLPFAFLSPLPYPHNPSWVLLSGQEGSNPLLSRLHRLPRAASHQHDHTKASQLPHEIQRDVPLLQKKKLRPYLMSCPLGFIWGSSPVIWQHWGSGLCPYTLCMAGGGTD